MHKHSNIEAVVEVLILCT